MRRKCGEAICEEQQGHRIALPRQGSDLNRQAGQRKRNAMIGKGNASRSEETSGNGIVWLWYETQRPGKDGTAKAWERVAKHSKGNETGCEERQRKSQENQCMHGNGTDQPSFEAQRNGNGQLGCAKAQECKTKQWKSLAKQCKGKELLSDAEELHGKPEQGHRVARRGLAKALPSNEKQRQCADKHRPSNGTAQL